MLILYLWVQIRTIWGGIKCVCKQFVKRQLFHTVRLRFRKSESSHRVDCFREDAKKPFSWVRVRTQHRKGQKGSMKLRKNSGSKKREKSLEISRFLVFPRSDLNWLVIMAHYYKTDPYHKFFRNRSVFLRQRIDLSPGGEVSSPWPLSSVLSVSWSCN